MKVQVSPLFITLAHFLLSATPVLLPYALMRFVFSFHLQESHHYLLPIPATRKGKKKKKIEKKGQSCSTAPEISLFPSTSHSEILATLDSALFALHETSLSSMPLFLDLSASAFVPAMTSDPTMSEVRNFFYLCFSGDAKSHVITPKHCSNCFTYRMSVDFAS